MNAIVAIIVKRCDSVNTGLWCRLAVMVAFLLLSSNASSKVGIIVKNYQGNVVFARLSGTDVIPVETLTGYGLLECRKNHLDKGIYLFLIGNKKLIFPVGKNQSFRIIADYSNYNIQNTVQISGSHDNSVFQEFLTLNSPRDKQNFWKNYQNTIGDPFIRDCIQALINFAKAEKQQR